MAAACMPGCPVWLTIAVKVLFIPYAILRVVNQLRDEREIVSRYPMLTIPLLLQPQSGARLHGN